MRGPRSIGSAADARRAFAAAARGVLAAAAFSFFSPGGPARYTCCFLQLVHSTFAGVVPTIATTTCSRIARQDMQYASAHPPTVGVFTFAPRAGAACVAWFA